MPVSTPPFAAVWVKSAVIVVVALSEARTSSIVAGAANAGTASKAAASRAAGSFIGISFGRRYTPGGVEPRLNRFASAARAATLWRVNVRETVMLSIALALALSASAALPVPHAAAAPVLTVDGVGTRAVLFDAAAFAALPRATATATIHGAMLTCTGAWLADVVAAAGVPTGEAVRGAALANVVVAHAADGYRVVFSLGEIERTLGRGQVLVADRCNGAPLPAGEGPWRLVVAGEVRGARSVRALERLTVVAVP